MKNWAKKGKHWTEQNKRHTQAVVGIPSSFGSTDGWPWNTPSTPPPPPPPYISSNSAGSKPSTPTPSSSSPDLADVNVDDSVDVSVDDNVFPKPAPLPAAAASPGSSSTSWSSDVELARDLSAHKGEVGGGGGLLYTWWCEVCLDADIGSGVEKWVSPPGGVRSSPPPTLPVEAVFLHATPLVGVRNAERDGTKFRAEKMHS